MPRNSAEPTAIITQEIATGNARLDRLFGATVHAVAAREDRDPVMARVAAELSAAGRRPFVVPLGASTPTGALGFARALSEVTAAGLRPDVIVHSTSSGGTQAGIIGGCALFGLKARVIGATRGPKIDGFVYKAKSNNRRRYGHRQDLSVLEITAIDLGDSAQAEGD